MSAINRKFFFDQVKLRLFDGKLSAKTRKIDGLSTSWTTWEKRPRKE